MTTDLRPRVLIADDDPDIRHLLARCLAKGYQTVAACDGREAVDAMRAGNVDLLLLDLMMPKVTGWQVLTERAASPELRKIPVIVITGERGEGITKILDAGICALLSKPVDLAMLQASVKSCLLQVESDVLYKAS